MLLVRLPLIALLLAGCTSHAAHSSPPSTHIATTETPFATSSQASPSGAPETPIEFPGVVVDRGTRQVRVDCEALGLVDTPLEFLCVMAGGPEHEAVLRTSAKPSDIHAGLLLLGLEPGSPVIYDETLNAWTPPRGPGVRAIAEWTDTTGRHQRMPAERLMRSIKDGTPMPPIAFIFAGSHVRSNDGVYLADLTGYVISICNFEHTLLDVPGLVSSSNDTLEWATDLDHGPARGTPVTLVLEPVDALSATTTTTRATQDDAKLSDLRRRRAALLDETQRVDRQIEQVDHNARRPVTRPFLP